MVKEEKEHETEGQEEPNLMTGLLGALRAQLLPTDGNANNTSTPSLSPFSFLSSWFGGDDEKKQDEKQPEQKKSFF